MRRLSFVPEEKSGRVEHGGRGIMVVEMMREVIVSVGGENGSVEVTSEYSAFGEKKEGNATSGGGAAKVGEIVRRKLRNRKAEF